MRSRTSCRACSVCGSRNDDPLYALELTPDDWRHEFIREWGELEIANAVADDRRQPVPSMDDPGVADAVRTLREMVGRKLDH